MTVEHSRATCWAIFAIGLGASCGASHGEGWPVDTRSESDDAASQETEDNAFGRRNADASVATDPGVARASSDSAAPASSDATSQGCSAALGWLDIAIDGGAFEHLTGGCGFGGGGAASPTALYFVAPSQSFTIYACSDAPASSVTFSLGTVPPTAPGPADGAMQLDNVNGLAAGPLHGTVLVEYASVGSRWGDAFTGTFSGDVDVPDAGKVNVQGSFRACLTFEATE